MGSNPIGDAKSNEGFTKNHPQKLGSVITGFLLFLSLPSDDHTHDLVMLLAIEFHDSLRIDVFLRVMNPDA